MYVKCEQTQKCTTGRSRVPVSGKCAALASQIHRRQKLLRTVCVSSKIRRSQSQQHCPTSPRVQTALLHLCGVSSLTALDSGPRGSRAVCDLSGQREAPGRGAQTEIKANNAGTADCAVCAKALDRSHMQEEETTFPHGSTENTGNDTDCWIYVFTNSGEIPLPAA